MSAQNCQEEVVDADRIPIKLFCMVVTNDSVRTLPDPDWIPVLSLWQPPDKGWCQNIQGLSHNGPPVIWLTDAQQGDKHLHKQIRPR